ncbi:aromatic ring-hydroxylating oxygenase subunit alpha [Gordonia insulae]|uniref:Biphenyl dioxygenase subunit alpha n=1 Tax=Gordonia insulae TaxID=2420509 RepID=A0A3G8JHX1_9ACTN|nr:aromatic ring-hydroxylating dioxygenase subunit alpha [Gordonia insulae]AZG44687.1 Biphenyl dioxygenase subunit alpha [Gordonia insulae]
MTISDSVTAVSPTDHVSAAGNRIVSGPLQSDSSQRALIPARAYVGQEEFDLEQERIFSSGWVWAGFAHWVDEPGKVHPVTVGGKPLLIIRGEDEQVRVFHNSCRHRGMAMLDEPAKVRRRIQCAYHCWSYNLDGSLHATPYFKRERTRALPEGADDLGLLAVSSRVWAGMVFVNLATDFADTDAAAADFAEMLAPITARWDHVDFDRIHLADEREFDIAVNWKLVVENFLDFYHLPFIHPQVGPVSASLDVDDVWLADHIIGGMYPRGAAGKTAKSDESLPFLGDVPVERTESQDIFCVFPNALLFLEADWFQVIGFDAAAPDRTVEHMAIFVDCDAAAEKYGPARKSLTNILFEVNEQDLPILHRLQVGRHSPASDRTNLVTHWDQITAHFQDLVARKAGYQ